MAISVDHVCDLTSKIENVREVKSRVVSVYSQDDMLNKKKSLKYPAVGVLYIGIRGKTDSSKTGAASNLICDILLLGGNVHNDNIRGVDQKRASYEILEDIRNEIMCTYAPSGHKWTFISELPFHLNDGIMAYAQRWSTTVLLTN